MFLNVANLLSLLDNLFTEYLYIYYLSSIQQESEKELIYFFCLLTVIKTKFTSLIYLVLSHVF